MIVSKGMIKTTLGAIGYLISEGQQEQSPSPLPSSLKTTILCFHGSPRSSDEYFELLPLLSGTGRRVVALDVPGYGISENPPKSCSIDDIADAFLEVADALEINRFVTIGCLMGNFVGVSLASRHPQRVLACIQANLYYYPPKEKTMLPPHAEKSKKEDTVIPDSWQLQEDGSHLVDLHNKRKWLDQELNLRVVQGEITYLVNRRARYAKGISIEDLSEYDFETPAAKVVCPTLCVRGEKCLELFDQIGFGGTEQFEAGCGLFSDCEVASLSGDKSTINMINQIPEEFALLCTSFLDKRGL